MKLLYTLGFRVGVALLIMSVLFGFIHPLNGPQITTLEQTIIGCTGIICICIGERE